MESMDIVAKNIDKIAELFPSCITEKVDDKGNLEKAIDFDVLRQILGDKVATRNEAYEFTWVGKNASRVEANTTTNKTLRPCIEESKDWDNTENLYIEGDNLEVLKLLQNSYFNKVKMIYIDPPYNTGNDFIYIDDFAQNIDEYEEAKGSFDEEGNRLFKNTDTNGRFHSDWCSMIYPRLILARNLLADDGVIFISIDDNEEANLKKICDEVFGEKNFIGCIVWNKRVPKNDNKGVGKIHESIYAYFKSDDFKQALFMSKEGLDEIFDFVKVLKKKKLNIEDAEKELKQFYKKKGYDRGITLYNNLDDNFDLWGKINLSWPNANSFGPEYDILHPKTKKKVKVPERGWRWNYDTFKHKLDYKNIIERYDKSIICKEIWFSEDERVQPSYIKYLKDVDKMLLRSIISLKSDGGIEIEKIFSKKNFFSYPKPVELIKMLINSLNTKDGIYIDFFSGSATTAHAVMQLNTEDGGKRKFIMVQLPEKTDEKSEAFKAGYKNICEIGKERIRRAGEKIKEEAGLNGQDLDIGFRVLKLDSSNMKDIYYSADEYDQGMLENMQSNTKEDRTDLDLLFGCLVDWGLELNKPYTTKVINDHKVHIYNDGDLVACFEKDLDMKTIDEIAKLQALRVVFSDNSFVDSATKINVAEHFKMIAPDTDIKVI